MRDLVTYLSQAQHSGDPLYEDIAAIENTLRHINKSIRMQLHNQTLLLLTSRLTHTLQLFS